ATRTIPIVGISDDMVGAGFVRSLARPGGNITGISILATELNSKRLELLMDALSNARRVAVLSDPRITTPQHSADGTSADATYARSEHGRCSGGTAHRF